MKKSTIRLLIVDDEATNLQLMRQILQDEYQLMFAKDGASAIKLADQHQPDLILMDIMMPGMSGYDAVEELKRRPSTQRIPVIFISAMSEVTDETYGFTVGAVDYILKPVSPPIVRARVHNHLKLVRVDELNATRLEIIQRLGRAAEYKDNETGLHVIRMSHYSQVLGRAAGLNQEHAEGLLNAAPMHDVGKIGIPDRILLKPGALDEEEWKVMRKHPYIGYKIIGEHDSPLLKLAADIAYCHHEKWNGAGYPRQLKGEAIPLEARIVAIADVFDALITARPYKPAWPVEKAINLIETESGQHFDPELAPLFLEKMPEILAIRERWKENATE
ncbi:MAG: response regulator [Gammaproteobacteria bacterium]|nr:response regulator [Gammaproteobacteria bacterium]